MVTVLGNTGNLAKSGYTFAGWNTQADGQGTDYTEGNTFTIDATTTLYAKWIVKTMTDLSYTGTPTKTAYNVGESFDPTGLTVTATFNDNSTEDVTSQVAWTPDLLTTGTTSVTGTYKDRTITVTGLTVTIAPGTTADNPYTVAEARAAIDANTGLTGVYATGIVSQIVTAYNSQYGNISYNISADGTTTADQLQAYRGKSYNGDNFTSADDIQVGDVVVIYGNLTKYNSTYEFAQDNQLVSLQRIETVATPTFSPEAGTYTSAQNVTITCATEGATIYYTTDGNDPTTQSTVFDGTAVISVNETMTIKAIAVKDGMTNSAVATAAYTIDLTPTVTIDGLTGNAVALEYEAGARNDIHFTATNTIGTAVVTFCDSEGGALTADPDWITASIDGAYIHLTWEANDGDARTAYLKVMADNATSQVITVTQAKFVVDYATLPFEWEGGTKNALLALAGVKANGLGSDYADSNAPYRVKLDGEGDYIQIKTDSQPGVVTVGVKMIGGANTSTLTVQESSDGQTFTDVEDLTISGTQNAELSLATTNPFATTTRYVRILKSAHGSNVGVGPISITKPGSTAETVATPTFSLEAGTYTSAQSVELACETEDATIHYTTDGSEPTAQSTEYTGAISVSATTTIKAIAVKQGLENSEVATATYTIDLTPSIVFDGNQNPDNEPYTAGSTNIHYVASNLTDAVTLVICDSEGAATTYDWFSAELNGDSYVAISWDANNDTENTRTAYFKLVAGDAVSDKFSVTQAKFVADYATLPFSFDGGRSDIENTSGLTQDGLDTDYSSSPKLKFNSAGDYVILQLNEAPGTLTFDIKGNSFSGSTFTVQTSADGQTYTDLETYTELGDVQHESFDNLSSDVRYIKWIYTTKASGNVALGNIAVTKASSAQTPSIVVSTQTTNPHSGDAGTAVIGFTKYNTNENVDQVIFYSDNAGLTTTTQPDWITNVSIDNQAGTVTLTMARNDGENAEARTAYLRVAIGETKSAATFITQGVYVVDYATLPFEWEGGTSSELTAVTGVTASGLGSDYNETHDPYLVKLDGDGDYIQVKTDSQPGMVTIGVKMIGGGNTSTITVQESSNGSTFTNVEELTISGSSNDELELETTNAFAAETRYVRLLFTKGSNVGVGPISIAQYVAPTPAITPETTSVNLYAVSYESKVIKLTYNFIDTNTSAPTVVFCDSEGGALTVDPDWISASINGEGNVAYNILANNNLTDARTAYMKVHGKSSLDGTTDVYSPIITVTQKALEYFDVALVASENINLYVFDTSDYQTPLNFSNGSVRLHGGTTIAISPDPAPGYILNELGVFDDNDREVRLSGPDESDLYTFELTCDVTIRATAEEIITYTVLIDEGENCTLNVFTSPTFALENGDEVLSGTRIYVSATPDDGYDTPTITVMAGDDELPLTYDDENEAYYFILQYDVIISAVAAAPAAPSTYALATTITSGKHYIIVGKKNEGYYAMGGQTDNNRTAVSVELNGDRITSNSDVEEFVIYGPYADGNYAIYTEAGDGGYLYAASSSKNQLKTEAVKDANGSWKIGFDATDGFASIVANGSNTHNVMQFNSASTLFACYSTSQSAVYLYEKDNDVLPEEKPFLSEYGYATWCSKNPLYFAADDEVSAWKVTGVQGENITFERLIGTVPGGTGILLKGQGYGWVTLTLASEVPNASAADVTDNLLVGVADPLKITSGQYYGLYETAFRKLGAGTVPDNRAILPQSISQSGVKAFTFVFNEGGIATGINELDNWTNYNSTIYNLNGQRLAKPQKGFNIINGKKVLFK